VKSYNKLKISIETNNIKMGKV